MLDVHEPLLGALPTSSTPASDTITAALGSLASIPENVSTLVSLVWGPVTISLATETQYYLEVPFIL